MHKTFHFLLAIASLSLVISCATSGGSNTGDSYKRPSVDPSLLTRHAPTHVDPMMLSQTEAVLDVRSPAMGALSRDGKSMFFNWTVTGVNQVWRVDSPKAFPVQMTGGSDPTILRAITPDGKQLVLERDQNGAEEFGIYLQSVKGGELTQVFHKPGVQAIFQRVSDDSRWLYYTANDVKKADKYVYRYDLKNNRRELLLSKPGYWKIYDVFGDAKILLGNMLAPNQNEIWSLDLETKKFEALLGVSEKGRFYVRFGSSSDKLIVATSKFGEFRRLYELKGGNFNEIGQKIPGSVKRFYLSRPRDKIVYQYNHNGRFGFGVLSAKHYGAQWVPSFKEAAHEYPGFVSHDSNQIMIGVLFHQSPRQSYVYDWKKGKLEKWVIPSVPEVSLKDVVSAKLEHFEARDGQKVPMYVRRPEGCKQKLCPVVVHFHGGPSLQSLPGFSKLAHLFNREGYIYVEPNVRGSSGYGKTWKKADDGENREKVITDIEDCAIHLRKTYAVGGVKPKVGVMGGSYGGYSALMGMTKFSGAYDAAVSKVGIWNLKTFIENTAPYRRSRRIQEYGDPSTQSDLLDRLSPSQYVSQIKGPVLIIQGVNDPRVPVSESIEAYKKIRSFQPASELVLFADEGHRFKKRKNRALWIAKTIEFFNRHLKSEVAELKP